MMQGGENGYETVSELGKSEVAPSAGGVVTLSGLVTVQESAGPRQLNRYNYLRAITVQGGVAPGYSLGQALEFLEQQARAAPEVAAIGYRGESQSLRETGSSIWLVFGLTILIVYLLLAAQFESFVHPAIIVTTVPLAVAGGVIGLALAGDSINLYS